MSHVLRSIFVYLWFSAVTRMCSSEYRTRCNVLRTTLIIVCTCILFAKSRQQKIQHILLWTNPQHFTHPPIYKGNKSFIINNCRYQNCIVSNKFTHVTQNVTKYDAILFNAMTMRSKPSIILPKKHTSNQLYILVSSKSATEFPVTNKYNNFFNWTWTYKLNSDISNAYIVIKNKNGKVIGPRQHMHWIPLSNMGKITTKIVSKLQFKTTAAAWFVSNCKQMGQYEAYIKKLRTHLKKYNHTLDIFGPCGNMICPENNIKKCYTLLEAKYYFYLSFEDSITEDYVTDQLLTALNHFAAPSVFGGANYSRFLPDGIYLDALELGPRNLAKKMNDIIENRKVYYDMFKWHNYYSFHSPYDNPDTNGICKLCKLLNDEKQRAETKVYENIVKWFNDRKDWNLENEDVSVLKESQKKQEQSEKEIKVNNNVQKVDEPRNGGANFVYETGKSFPDNSFEKNGETNEDLSDTFNEHKKNDIAEDQQIENTGYSDIYNDIGLVNEKQNITIKLSTERENLIDVIKHREKETLKNKQKSNATEPSQAKIKTIKHDTVKVQSKLETENKVLEEMLKRLEKLVKLNNEKLQNRNNSKRKNEFTEFNFDESQEIFVSSPIDITTIEGIYKNQSHIGMEQNLKDVINPLQDESTTKKQITNTTLPQSSTKIYNNTSSAINEFSQNYDGLSVHKIFTILLWTNVRLTTFPSLKVGRRLFTDHHCRFQNCELSYKINSDVIATNYDAVLFDAVELNRQIERPENRARHQKYVLVSRSSAANYPLPRKFNNFFNWTWTYKLNSDVKFSDIVIKDANLNVIGPRENMHWIPIEEMLPTPVRIIRRLQSKTIAIAWIVTDCVIMERHEYFVVKLRNELRKFNHILNIYGECGNMKCPENKIDACYALLQSEYFFYMSFEDSMAEDYVTESLLIALNTYVVPLVFGGANYTRFMPDGIYLDALKLGAVELAKKIDHLMENQKFYYDMFKWHNHYKYYNAHDDADTNGFCEFCALLNDNKRRREITVYKNIVKWFNDRKDWNRRDDSFDIRLLHPKKGKGLIPSASENDPGFFHYDTPTAEVVTVTWKPIDKYTKVMKVSPGLKYPNVRSNTVTYNIPVEKQPEYVLDTRDKPMPISCPDITTCVNTIIDNVKSKLNFLFS